MSDMGMATMMTSGFTTLSYCTAITTKTRKMASPTTMPSCRLFSLMDSSSPPKTMPYPSGSGRLARRARMESFTSPTEATSGMLSPVRRKTRFWFSRRIIVGPMTFCTRATSRR